MIAVQVTKTKRCVLFYRMIHGFTSAGLLESQYASFCGGARLGCLNEHYVANGTVYQTILLKPKALFLLHLSNFINYSIY